ncbi:MAG: TetR/AcrR family transcriptional regulator [Methylophaga sp.]|nr:TetR/AcrR family transcriptional regulator [Methylophaga sp.]
MIKNIQQRYHHGDLRTSLIKATVEMINKQGVEAITMRSLSNWVGVSRTAAYRHFSNKVDLLTATATEGFKQFSLALRVARLDYSEDELGRFRLMGQAYVQFAIEHSAYYGLMFSDASIQKTDAFDEASSAAFTELVDILVTLQEANKIKTEDPKMQANFVWSLMHGFSSLLINGKLQHIDDLSKEMTYLDQKIMASLVE